MSEHHVIGSVGTHPNDPRFVEYSCPECGRRADTSPVYVEELDANGCKSCFCGRWGCDALLHIHTRVNGHA